MKNSPFQETRVLLVTIGIVDPGDPTRIASRSKTRKLSPDEDHDNVVSTSIDVVRSYIETASSHHLMTQSSAPIAGGPARPDKNFELVTDPPLIVSF